MYLAIDTATPWCSVALVAGDQKRAESSQVVRNAGPVLIDQIDDVMVEAGVSRRGLEGVAVGIGPGPYTGTRIGVTVARTLALALSIPVVGICTLDAIAAQVIADGWPAEFIVATDARRGEVYWAHYDSAGRRLLGPAVTKPVSVLERFAQLPWFGVGVERHAAVVDAAGIELSEVDRFVGQVGQLAARGIAAGQQVPESEPELVDHAATGGAGSVVTLPLGLMAAYPLYLRRPDAVAPAGR